MPRKVRRSRGAGRPRRGFGGPGGRGWVWRAKAAPAASAPAVRHGRGLPQGACGVRWVPCAAYRGSRACCGAYGPSAVTEPQPFQGLRLCLIQERREVNKLI